MADDYRVKRLSNFEIRTIAKKARDFFGVADSKYVDVIACLKSPVIWTVTGKRRLIFQVRPDSEMGTEDGSTNYGKGVVAIAVKKSVYDEAFLGVGRPRNTLAHELAHGVMHDGVEMYRRSTGNATPKWLKTFESAEHQAKVFAPSFLINDAVAEKLSSANEISITFGVSLESATIYYEELSERRDRERSAEKVRQLAEEFRESVTPPRFKIRYLDEPCNICGNQTVFPVGQKYMCQTCDMVFDRFQDGD
jgi:hypothetical protein